MSTVWVCSFLNRIQYESEQSTFTKSNMMSFRPYYIDDIWAILTQGCQGDMKLLKGENQCKLITVYFKKGDYIPRHLTSILDILYIYYFLIYVAYTYLLSVQVHNTAPHTYLSARTSMGMQGHFFHVLSPFPSNTILPSVRLSLKNNFPN